MDGSAEFKIICLFYKSKSFTEVVKEIAVWSITRKFLSNAATVFDFLYSI